MTAAWIFMLTVGAVLLLAVRGHQWQGAGDQARGGRPRGILRHLAAGLPGTLFGRPRTPKVAMPRVVRQLSALLASGRSGPALWGALAETLAAEYGPPIPERAQRISPEPDAVMHASPTIVLVLAVQRAVLLGLPAAAALRSACRQTTAPARPLLARAGTAGLTQQQEQTWLELAACLEVCEASGAPVAAVLARLATRLESEDDGAAMRETALAGPRATVRLLTWLPFVGLGLGMAMGVDPLGVLLGSPLGWACLVSGLALVVAGRAWSTHLISVAARPGRPKGSRRHLTGVAGPRGAAR